MNKRMKRGLVALILCAPIQAIFASDGCNLEVGFGPVSFEQLHPIAALKQVLVGTGISLIDSPELNSIRISAHQVSGILSQALQRMSEGTGLDYPCHDGVMRVVAAGVTELDVNTQKMTSTVPVSSPASDWTLTVGSTVKASLERWASQSGWHVVWDEPKDWVVPATSSFEGTFQTAAETVIQTLAANGALIHAQFYLANHTMVVNGAPE